MPVPIEYSLRSLWARRASTSATVAGVALVVFVLASSQMLANGLQRTLRASGSRDRVVLLQQGATAEGNSLFEQNTLNLAAAVAGVRHGAAGQPLIVGEAVVPVTLPRSDDPARIVSVFVRGVTQSSLALRPRLRVIAGRLPAFGSDEAMIGASLAGRYEGLKLGGRLELLAGRPMAVVGVFEADGSAFESEVWADLDAVRQALAWQGYLSSVTLQLDSPESFERFEAGWKLVNNGSVTAMRESDYYDQVSHGLANLFVGVGGAVAIIFSFGAVLGAAIATYGSTHQRTREIGMLRALGFRRKDIVAAFLLELASLSGFGAALGLSLALATSLTTLSTRNGATGGELSFHFVPTASTIAGSVAVAVLIGLLGGLFPCVKAARIQPVQALRT